MKIDVFCHVIDFLGDIAVSFRLALAMKRCRPSWGIRYFCDGGADTLPQLFKGVIKSNTMQLYGGVEIYPSYRDEFAAPVDVAIEALACDLPDTYPLPALIINLEYLTAENWASSYHLNQSYKGDGHKKYFFFPGVKPHTGGLTWGKFIEMRDHANSNPLVQRKKFLEHMGLTHLDAEQPWATVYAYQSNIASLEAQPNVLFFLPSYQQGKLPVNCVATKMLEMVWYDSLVMACDFNLVRGEDSLSRALLSGKPFLWQAYRQEACSHWLKIEALLELLRHSFLDPNTYTIVEQQYHSYNDDGSFSPTFFSTYHDELLIASQSIAKTIMTLGPQELNLIRFIEKTYRGGQ